MTWGSGALGSTQLLVLQMVGNGRATTLPEIRASLKSRFSGESLNQMVALLVRRGFLHEISGSRFSLSAKGAALVPKVQAPMNNGRYVPPDFRPLRPGAMDYAKFPSIAAGVSRPYHAEGVL